MRTNSAAKGGGICLLNDTKRGLMETNFSNTIITENTATELGGGFSVEADSNNAGSTVVTFNESCAVYDNTADSGADDFYKNDKSTVNALPTAAQMSAAAKNAVISGWYKDELENRYSKDNASEYTPMDSTTDALQLKAVKAEQYTVKFDSQGGSTVSVQITISGGNVEEPTPPMYDGYEFAGWYTDAACQTKYDFTSPVTGDITLYAKWNKNSGGGGGSTTTYFYFAIEKVDTQDGHALNAATVRNYRGSTPELLNGEDHFAYIVGHNDGNVYPNGLISRAETAAVFFRLLKDEVRDGNLLTSNTYSDVPDDYWANTAISTMTGLGIVQGHSGTTFDPEAPITRAQFAAICARFDTGAGGTTQTFSDISGHWAEEYIRQVAGLGWIKGFEDGTFRPDTYITRAQAMTMINRVLNRIPEENSDLPAGMNTWPDCNPGDWFSLAVQEATNSHAFQHKTGNFETWTGMNKTPDWTRYEH